MFTHWLDYLLVKVYAQLRGITDIVHFDHHLDLQIWTYHILDTQCISYLLLDENYTQSLLAQIHYTIIFMVSVASQNSRAAHLKLLAQVLVQPTLRYWPGSQGSQDSSRAEWLLTWPTHSSDCAEGSWWFLFPTWSSPGGWQCSPSRRLAPLGEQLRPKRSHKDLALEVVLPLAS